MRLLNRITSSAIFLIFVCSVTSAADFDNHEQAMLDWIDGHFEDAVALLEQTVNISSGSLNIEGVKAVGSVMNAELESLGLDTEWIDMPVESQRAGHLVGRSAASAGKRFLLIGHLDTVFEADDEFQAFTRNGNIAIGPGVDDMKSGNVVIIYALKALQHVGVLDSLPVVVFYTGDEEKMARPLSVSRKDLIDAGRWADIALGFESAAFRDGKDWATIARRGSSGWRLEVSGKQAHSSGIFSEDAGAGAIFEAARILSSFYETVRGEEYLTFNAGTISGGTQVDYDFEQNRGETFGKTNVIPKTVIVHGGIRTISIEQLNAAQDAMRGIVADSLPHTSATITFDEGYPPMSPTEGNRRLQVVLSDLNQQLGRGPMETYDPSLRGAADISFVAPYTDGLAGLGAIGSGGHTPDESLELDSFTLAIKRAAILIYRLSQEQAR